MSNDAIEFPELAIELAFSASNCRLAANDSQFRFYPIRKNADASARLNSNSLPYAAPSVVMHATASIFAGMRPAR